MHECAHLPPIPFANYLVTEKDLIYILHQLCQLFEATSRDSAGSGVCGSGAAQASGTAAGANLRSLPGDCCLPAQESWSRHLPRVRVNVRFLGLVILLTDELEVVRQAQAVTSEESHERHSLTLRLVQRRLLSLHLHRVVSRLRSYRRSGLLHTSRK